MPFVLLGLLIQIYQGGLLGLGKGLGALMIPMVILFPLFLLRMLPAGDIKLFGAIGALTGITFVAHTFIYGFFIAGLYGLLLFIRHKIFLERMTYFYRYILRLILTKHYEPYHKTTQKNSQKETTTYQYPLAGFIALGAILHVFLLNKGFMLY